MSLEWRGINSTQICFEKSCFSFKKDHVTYAIEIAVIGNEKKISISVDTPTTFEKIYHYLGDIRRYEYLVDGAFYCMKKCKTDGIDVTNSITDVELPYFFSEKYMQGIGMTGTLALPTLIAICSAALGKTPLNSLAILGEISIGGTLIKVDELASTLQVCLDSGAKKVLLPITSAGDIGTVPSDLVGAFSLIFYSSAEEAVFKALGVE